MVSTCYQTSSSVRPAAAACYIRHRNSYSYSYSYGYCSLATNRSRHGRFKTHPTTTTAAYKPHSPVLNVACISRSYTDPSPPPSTLQHTHVHTGTYQTPHQLVMVTEPLDCGDLWSIIYETAPYKVITPLPPSSLSLSLSLFLSLSLSLSLSVVCCVTVISWTLFVL
jgi:hypothetical protein